MVVLFHARLALPGGFTGVDVFFVISGFVITASLAAELERTERIALPAFYLRRMKRLLPALAVVVAFVALVGTLAAPAVATHMSGMTGIFASFFSANLYIDTLPSGYFSVSTQLNPLLHTWTLAVEEQFYLIFPALLFGAWWFGQRRGGRGRTAALIVMTLVACESLWLATRATGVGGRGFGYYGSPPRAWEFAVGCLIALSSGLLKRLPRLLAGSLAAIGVAGLVTVALAVTATSSLALRAGFPVASAAALVAAGCAPNFLSRLVGVRPLAWVGDISYSLYLWHWPLIVFVHALIPRYPSAVTIAAACSVLPAWLSYRFVENPLRRSPRIRGRHAAALVAVCIAVPATLSFGASRLPLVKTPAFDAGNHADLSRGCASDDLYGSRSRAKCVWPARDPRGDVVLIGDSNAGQFTEPFVRAANRAGFSAIVATPAGCPFTQLQVANTSYDLRPCVRFDGDALRQLIRRKPNLVAIGGRWDEYLRDSRFSLGYAGQRMTRDAKVKQWLWMADLAAEVAALNQAGVPVVLLHPIPFLPTGRNSCAVVLLLLNRCGGSMPRAEADRQLRRALEGENRAANGRRAWVVSFEDDLCSRDRCSTSRDGLILYRNLDHLSIGGSLKLTRRFSEEVISHALRSRPLATDSLSAVRKLLPEGFRAGRISGRCRGGPELVDDDVAAEIRK